MLTGFLDAVILFGPHGDAGEFLRYIREDKCECLALARYLERESERADNGEGVAGESELAGASIAYDTAKEANAWVTPSSAMTAEQKNSLVHSLVLSGSWMIWSVESKLLQQDLNRVNKE